jgi:hypothetical protein
LKIKDGGSEIVLLSSLRCGLAAPLLIEPGVFLFVGEDLLDDVDIRVVIPARDVLFDDFYRQYFG